MTTFEATRFVKTKMVAFHSANNVHCLCGFRLFAIKMFTKKYYGIGGFYGGIYIEKSRESGGINFC